MEKKLTLKMYLPLIFGIVGYVISTISLIFMISTNKDLIKKLINFQQENNNILAINTPVPLDQQTSHPIVVSDGS